MPRRIKAQLQNNEELRKMSVSADCVLCEDTDKEFEYGEEEGIQLVQNSGLVSSAII